MATTPHSSRNLSEGTIWLFALGSWVLARLFVGNRDLWFCSQRSFQRFLVSILQLADLTRDNYPTIDFNFDLLGNRFANHVRRNIVLIRYLFDSVEVRLVA